MNITVNGKLRTVPSGITILHLLQHFELGHERIAVEHNRSFRSRLIQPPLTSEFQRGQAT